MYAEGDTEYDDDSQPELKMSKSRNNGTFVV